MKGYLIVNKGKTKYESKFAPTLKELKVGDEYSVGGAEFWYEFYKTFVHGIRFKHLWSHKPENYKYFEISVLGDIDEYEENIYYTNKLKIIKEVQLEVVKKLSTGEFKFTDRIEWRKDGLLHNESGPAIIWSNGDMKYYVDGINTEKTNQQHL